MPFQHTPLFPALHQGLLVNMPGVLTQIPRVTPSWQGWLPHLSPREPTRPESLRARLYRLSHTLNPRAQNDYPRLMNSIHGYTRSADF
jgi:NADH:ubiquinone oxidoreductase subunit